MINDGLLWKRKQLCINLRVVSYHLWGGDAVLFNNEYKFLYTYVLGKKSASS